MSRRSSPRLLRRIGMAGVAAALLAGCGAGTASESAASPQASPAARVEAPFETPGTSTAPAPAPVPALPADPPPPPTEVEGAAFTEDYWPIPRDDAMVPEGLGPLTVSVTLEEYRLPCTESERRITGVDVGPGRAARRIAAALLEAARLEHAEWRSWFASEDDCRYGPDEPILLHGDTEQVLVEEPCTLPGGPPLRCFLLVDYGYAAGAAHGYLRLDQLAFDATTGERLSVADILAPAGIDQPTAESLIASIICRLDGTRGACLATDLDRARPTADGLVIAYAPYEAGSYAKGTRELFVPWRLLVRPSV